MHILDGPETSSGAGNFMPSWVYWLQLPRLCMLPRIVELDRDTNGSLGFSIVGGTDNMLPGPPQPIIVKSIVPGGPAHRDGRLRWVQPKPLRYQMLYNATPFLRRDSNPDPLMLLRCALSD